MAYFNGRQINDINDMCRAVYSHLEIACYELGGEMGADEIFNDPDAVCDLCLDQLHDGLYVLGIHNDANWNEALTTMAGYVPWARAALLRHKKALSK